MVFVNVDCGNSFGKEAYLEPLSSPFLPPFLKVSLLPKLDFTFLHSGDRPASTSWDYRHMLSLYPA